tara:strand:- start:1994 stop:2227 length:234 start_codon:yes stop_codon:yes gene_type:complete
MHRKTTSVKDMIEDANFNLARTDPFATTDYKRAICDMLEGVLMNTGNYRGFGFIDNDDSDHGTHGYYARYYYISKKL